MTQKTIFEFSTAAVLIEILSAPQLSNLLISSTLLTPPPTVSGTKHFLDVFSTTTNENSIS